MVASPRRKSMSRRSIGGVARHPLGERTSNGVASPSRDSPAAKGGRGSLPAAYKADQRAVKAMDEAKRIITAQQDLDVGSTPSTSTTTPYNIHALLRSFATRQKTSGSRRQSSHNGPATMTDENGAWNPLEIDWHVFNEWPEGLEREEREMKQYYKYLKFIHLEHETKIRFITEIVDDLEADPPREAIVYTPRDVKEKESEMYAAKAQLKQAKQSVRTLRSEVDTLSQRVAEPYRQLDASCAEAKALLDECMDLELELVRLKNEGGSVGGITELDVEEMDLETLPPVGTLTSTEAERFCERQEEELVALEESNSHVDSLMSRLRSDAKAAIRDVDRLSSEKNGAERSAREALELGVGGRKRDKEVERVCASHSATLALLRSLLGLRRIEAPDDKRLHLIYLSSADGCELALVLHFDRPGGKLTSIELHHPTQAPITLPPTQQQQKKQPRKSLRPNAQPDVTQTTVAPEFGTLMKAIQANDVPAVVMEGWDWVERKARELVGQ